MRFLFAAAIALVLMMPQAFAAGSLTLSLNSLDAISANDSATLVATVSASGDSVSNAQVSISLPSGLTTSDSTTQSIGQMSSGQQSQKTWSITGNSAGTYTITVTATGDSVTAQTSTATLTVNSPAYISVTTTTPPTTATVANGDSASLGISFSNTGGTSSTVTASITPSSGLTMTSGSATNSFDLNAGQNTSLSWAFQMVSTSNQTITVSITSSNGGISSYTTSHTITGVGTASAANPGGDNNAAIIPPLNAGRGPGGSEGPSGSPPGTKCSPIGKTQACGTGLNGICAAGTQKCNADGTWGVCAQAKQPKSKICASSLDNDCNGKIDADETECTNSVVVSPENESGAAKTGVPGEGQKSIEGGIVKGISDLLFAAGIGGAILIIGGLVVVALGAIYWFGLRKGH